jgi:DNA-binding response OmpR family regulator
MMAAESVLVLEDNGDLRMMMCDLFESFGARCVGVGSLEEMQRLGATERLSFDLVILDVNLGAGRPSGVDAYRWLRDQSFSGRIVFMTGHVPSLAIVADAHSIGVKVLHKPVSIDDLMGLLREPPKTR